MAAFPRSYSGRKLRIKPKHTRTTYSYKGVEYEFVNTEKQFLEELKCPICLELVSDPVQTSCGHLFCEKCIKGAKTCPVDREQFTSHKDNYNDRRLRNFKVNCPNTGRGCRWQGDLGGATRHTDENCDFQTVECANEGCDVKVGRGQLVDHMHNACPQRKYNCPFCDEEDTYLKVTTTHFTMCEDMPLPCPGGCGRRGLVRRNMAQHLSTECPEELVACKFAIAGCHQAVKRKDVQQHLLNKDLHLDTVLSSYVALTLLVRDVVHTVNSGNQQTVETSRLPLNFNCWLQNTPTCYPRVPQVFTVAGFQEKKEEELSWFSDPVYSHFGGYKMCLRVDAYGTHADAVEEGNDKHTHVSVYVYLMRGDNDDNLKWPFKGTIKVSLLNQLEDGKHYTQEVWSPDSDVPEISSGRVINGERSAGLGLPNFIPHKDLNYCPNKNCQYLKDDTLFFRVDCIELNLD